MLKLVQDRRLKKLLYEKDQFEFKIHFYLKFKGLNHFQTTLNQLIAFDLPHYSYVLLKKFSSLFFLKLGI